MLLPDQNLESRSPHPRTPQSPPSSCGPHSSLLGKGRERQGRDTVLFLAMWLAVPPPRKSWEAVSVYLSAVWWQPGPGEPPWDAQPPPVTPQDPARKIQTVPPVCRGEGDLPTELARVMRPVRSAGGDSDAQCLLYFPLNVRDGNLTDHPLRKPTNGALSRAPDGGF